MVAIRLLALGFSSLLEMTFSIARTTPSLHRIPTDVPPFSTALTAYSTWKFRPSGEKTEFVRSYPVPMDVYSKAMLAIKESVRTRAVVVQNGNT